MDIVEQNQIVSPRLRSLISWYESQSATAGAWPAKGALDPTLIPPESRPFVAIVDVQMGPMRIIYHMLGGALVEAIGMDLTGKFLDEVDIPQAKDLPEWFQRGVAAPGALFARSTQTVQHVNLVYEGSCFPFGESDDDPRSLLICEDFLSAEFWQGATEGRATS